MSNTLIVPARLEKAARELVNNVTMLKACSPEVKEVIAMAAEKGLLKIYALNNGDKCPGQAKGISLGGTYCLPDDIQIVVESQVPTWVSKKYTVCEIQNQEDKQFRVTYPNGYWRNYDGLPAALRCEGWVFCGWLHKGYNYVDNCPLMFNTGRDFWRSLSESRDLDGYESSTAYASVWQKAGEK